MPGVTQQGLQPTAPSKQRPSVPQAALCRRHLVASAASLALLSAQRPARADFASDARAKLSAGEKAFADSELLKALREKSDTNRVKNKTEITNKYCYRQAEVGVGDCAGLRLIPGATKSGRQKPPEWLKALPFYPKDQPAEKKGPAGDEE